MRSLPPARSMTAARREDSSTSRYDRSPREMRSAVTGMNVCAAKRVVNFSIEDLIIWAGRSNVPPMSDRPFKEHLYEQFARVGAALASRQRLELIDLLAQAPRHVEAL